MIQQIHLLPQAVFLALIIADMHVCSALPLDTPGLMMTIPYTSTQVSVTYIYGYPDIADNLAIYVIPILILHKILRKLAHLIHIPITACSDPDTLIYQSHSLPWYGTNVRQDHYFQRSPVATLSNSALKNMCALVRFCTPGFFNRRLHVTNLHMQPPGITPLVA